MSTTRRCLKSDPGHSPVHPPTPPWSQKVNVMVMNGRPRGWGHSGSKSVGVRRSKFKTGPNKIWIKLEQLERLRSEDTPRHLMITHTIESCWIPSHNKVEWPWRYRSRSKVITCNTPSHASNHLYQTWKESIQNYRRYRADTIFKVKAEWPWKYRSRSKVITCYTPSNANDDLCQIWKEYKQNCRFFF